MFRSIWTTKHPIMCVQDENCCRPYIHIHQKDAYIILLGAVVYACMHAHIIQPQWSFCYGLSIHQILCRLCCCKIYLVVVSVYSHIERGAVTLHKSQLFKQMHSSSDENKGYLLCSSRYDEYCVSPSGTRMLLLSLYTNI